MAKLNTSSCTPFLLFLLFIINFSFSESITLPLNLETRYPYTLPVPVPPPPAVAAAPAADYSPAITPPPPPPRSPTPSSASTKKIAAAIAATAATTFVAVGLLFLFWSRLSRPPQGAAFAAAAVAPAASRSEFTRIGGRIKGVVIDEDGLDVIYWRSLKSSGRSRSSSADTDIHSGGGGQTQPAPPPEMKIPVISPPPHFPPTKMMPPPPPNSRRNGGSSLSETPALQKLPSDGSKTLEAIAKQQLQNSMAKGSFQYNGDMMEAMFGVMATNRKVPIQDYPSSRSFEALNPNPKIFILDPKKSQDIAVVLESFGVPPSKLIESLHKGKGLSIGELEKLVRIAPTRREESEIMAFDGDSARLADAELFFYSLLKAVPSAFMRANAMLFRLRYDSEIGIIQESLRALESACIEIRSCGVFLKLLESILNAGSQLSGGTATNAKAFSLEKLLKLSDYRSSDGTTTLLNFVVHKAVRNEGRRCVLATNNSTNDPVLSKAEKEREFLKLGLPVVGGLSSDLSNVKKAACLGYEALPSSLASLKGRVDETRQLVAECRSSGGGFVKEMEGFLESAQADIKTIRERQTRVMDNVMRATQDYQAADSNSSDSNPLHLFVMVKDFLAMVDQACIEITRSLQQKKPATAVSGSGSSQPDVLRGRVTFPRLPDHFLSDKD